jgi:capsular polysaccharide biosynthesis protein
MLEDLPLLTQIRWFAEARAVVGLHGAGLANLAFCRPRTRVVELVPTAWRNPCFANMARQVRADYKAVPVMPTGERTGFAADASLSPSRLAALVTHADH